MYLYLGYLVVQFYPLIVKVLQLNISISAIFFSITIVFIWSFIPFLGYWVAKLFNSNANAKAGKFVLFTLGVGIGLIESSLFYFDLLTNEQSTIGTFIVFLLFFVAAFFPINEAANNS